MTVTDPVADLAARLLDGSEVDWRAEVSRADDGLRPIVSELSVLAALAEVHRRALTTVDPTNAWSSAVTGPAAVQLDLPTRWGHLDVLDRIGSGTTSVVYRAWDSRLDREVALKLLPAEPAANPLASALIDEGRLLARVHHPHVVTIFGAERLGGQIGLWMELVRGHTLEECLIDDGPFAPEAVAAIGVQLCQAVAAVHAAGLLHRDIKAHNVMRTSDGRVVLMDLGTGRPLDDQSASDLTGTPLYLAPEVFLGQPATRRSDVYSLGVLLHRLLTGSYPVRGRTIQDIRLAHERGDVSSLRETRPDVPARLALVVDRAMHADPTMRYADAEVLGRQLAEFRRPAQSRGWRRSAAGASLALLGAAAWWLLGEGNPAVPSRPAHPITVAVLPFTDAGAAPLPPGFAEGLTTEIVRQLAEVDGLSARSALLPSRGASATSGLGPSLGVDYVVEGSVEHAGDRARASARLTRVTDNAAVWSDQFERRAGSALPLQEEIAAAIANALSLSLGQTRRRVELPFESNFLFVRAQGLLTRRSPENLAQAVDLFDQVTKRQPESAHAWAALASATALLSTRDAGETMPPPDPRTMPAARKAVALDPLLPEAHAAIGNAAARERQWALAEASFERALELGPRLTTVYTDFVLSTLLPLGRLDAALARLRAARTIDPLSLDVRRVMALLEVDSGRYADAIASSEWVLEREPAFPYADTWLGRALALSGRHADALAVLRRNQINWGYVGYVLAVSGRRAEAEALAAEHPESPSRQMLIYAGLGDRDRAAAALERAAVDNWWRAATWMRRPELAVLRGDPRLAALAAKLGVPE